MHMSDSSTRIDGNKLSKTGKEKGVMKNREKRKEQRLENG